MLDNNSSGSLHVTRDSERLAQVNDKEMKLQVHVHEDPLLAAKQNSLGRPKRKIPRREKPRHLRQVSEQTMSITKQAKKF